MKAHLMQQLEGTPLAARENVAREYLQVYLLRLLHERGAMEHVAFVGGTALRLLHRLPRFSEDLDFCATVQPGISLEGVLGGIQADLERAGYRTTVRVRQPRNVAQGWIRFDGLPAECGWLPDPRRSLSIRVEVDLSPPAGAELETTLIQRFFPIALKHHTLPSLFAGKLHAILARPWAKGRDWFDLVWYLTTHTGLEPNRHLLAEALRQTGHSLPDDDWSAAVRARFARLEWQRVLADVRPFLERSADLEHLSREAVEKLL